MKKTKSARTSSARTAKATAERAKPGWRAVGQTTSDAARDADAEVSSPELTTLRRKYLGNADNKNPSRRARKADNGATEIVVMEPKNASDARFGRKAMVVKNGKVIGEQG